MLPLLLLMLPAAAAAVGSGECEHSTLLQKNLASLKALKVTEDGSDLVELHGTDVAATAGGINFEEDMLQTVCERMEGKKAHELISTSTLVVQMLSCIGRLRSCQEVCRKRSQAEVEDIAAKAKSSSGSFFGEEEKSKKEEWVFPAFDVFPETLRLGPWSPLAKVFLVILVSFVLCTLPFLTRPELPSTKWNWTYAAVSAYMIFVQNQSVYKYKWFPLATYTCWSYFLLNLHFLFHAVDFPLAAELLRFPSLAMATVTTTVWWLVLFPVILGCLVADSFCGQHDPTQKAKTRPFFSLSSGMMKIYQPKPAALGQTCSSHTRVYELEGHLRHIGVHVSFHVRILRFKKPVWLHEAELQLLPDEYASPQLSLGFIILLALTTSFGVYRLLGGHNSCDRLLVLLLTRS
eukprot:g11492.t1